MSMEGMAWGFKDSPTNAYERLIVTAMGDAADPDGCTVILAQSTIADIARIDERTVRRYLVTLEERGVIARGDQTAADYLPPGHRPVVYDVMIPYSWFGNIGRINAYRAAKGRSPLTPENRPDLVDAPAKKGRADKGAVRVPGLQVPPHPGLQVRADEPHESDFSGGLEVRGGTGSGVENRTEYGESQVWGDFKSDNHKRLTLSTNPLLPLVGLVTEGTESSPSGGGGSSEDNQVTIAACVEWFAKNLDRGRYVQLAARWPKAWNAATVEEALTKAVADKLGDLKTAAGVLRRLADGEYGECRSPRRMLILDGPWWAASASQGRPEAEAQVCNTPAHYSYGRPVKGGCKECAGDAKAAPDDEAAVGVVDEEFLRRYRPHLVPGEADRAAA